MPGQWGESGAHVPPYDAASAGRPADGPGRPFGAGPEAPLHREAGTILGFGLGTLVGTFFCVLPGLVGLYPLIVGLRVRREIRDAGGAVGGEGRVLAGMICGGVGFTLAIIACLGILLALVLFAAPLPSEP